MGKRAFASSKKIERAGLKLTYLTLFLLVVGIIFVADVSAPTALRQYSDEYYFVKQQLIWGSLGLILLFLFSKLHYNFWKKTGTYLFIFGLFLLLLVLVPDLSRKALGARRWLSIGSFSLQPSEAMKLFIAIYVAKLSIKQKRIISYIIPLALTVLLIMLQPDFGTTLVIIAIALVQFFVSGMEIIKIVAISTFGALGGLLLVLFSPYRKDRLLTFLQSSGDPLGKSYHIRQVIIALGSGGLLGVGLGQSRQKYLFLPETATDSIFAVIAEEIGFLGSTMVVLLLAAFVFLTIKIAREAPDKFSSTLAIGISTWFATQIVLNVGSMVAIVPLTGITLPFFSYGGSSLTSVLAATGILVNISNNASKKRK